MQAYFTQYILCLSHVNFLLYLVLESTALRSSNNFLSENLAHLFQSFPSMLMSTYDVQWIQPRSRLFLDLFFLLSVQQLKIKQRTPAIETRRRRNLREDFWKIGCDGKIYTRFPLRIYSVSKCDQIHWKLQILSHLLENFLNQKLYALCSDRWGILILY